MSVTGCDTVDPAHRAYTLCCEEMMAAASSEKAVVLEGSSEGTPGRRWSRRQAAGEGASA